VEGRRQEAALTLGFPAAAAAETNLLGDKVANVLLKGGVIRTCVYPSVESAPCHGRDAPGWAYRTAS
jgi:hypothetical protein